MSPWVHDQYLLYASNVSRILVSKHFVSHDFQSSLSSVEENLKKIEYTQKICTLGSYPFNLQSDKSDK